MKGTMITIPPAGPETVEQLSAGMDQPEMLVKLQAAVEGYIEAVPYWRMFQTQHGAVRCVAFCNEEGKLNRSKPLPYNARATAAWDTAMRRAVGCGCSPDYLVGNVVILTGDDEFMRSLYHDPDEAEL